MTLTPSYGEIGWSLVRRCLLVDIPLECPVGLEDSYLQNLAVPDIVITLISQDYSCSMPQAKHMLWLSEPFGAREHPLDIVCPVLDELAKRPKSGTIPFVEMETFPPQQPHTRLIPAHPLTNIADTVVPNPVTRPNAHNPALGGQLDGRKDFGEHQDNDCASVTTPLTNGNACFSRNGLHGRTSGEGRENDTDGSESGNRRRLSSPLPSLSEDDEGGDDGGEGSRGANKVKAHHRRVQTMCAKTYSDYSAFHGLQS